MRITDFEIYRELLQEKSGLLLTENNSYLLDSRLGPVAKKWGYPSPESMAITLQVAPDKKLVDDVIEAMTIHDTSFFRDETPFNDFRDLVLPHLLKKKKSKKTLRIWCAGSASGQEPYSLAILMKENVKLLQGWKPEILATDIARDALNKAREAIYSQFEAQRGLSIQTLLKYFTPLDKGDWRLNEDVKQMVRHDYFNLIDSMAKLGTFDAIFCRNVISYFDAKTKKSVLERMAAQLDKDGFLFLGDNESAIGVTEALKPALPYRGLYIHANNPFKP